MLSQYEIAIVAVGGSQLLFSLSFYIAVALFRTVSLQQHKWHMALMYTASVLYQVIIILSHVYSSFYTRMLVYLIIFSFIASAVYSQLRLIGALLPICPLLNAKFLSYFRKTVILLYLFVVIDKSLQMVFYTWQFETVSTISGVNSIDLVYFTMGRVSFCAGIRELGARHAIYSLLLAQVRHLA